MFGLRPIRHRDLSMYNNCFFENWYQRSRDRDFPLIVQYFDFHKEFKGRSSGRKAQDPVLSFFENSKRISWEIPGFDTICIFCSLRFLVISHRFRLVSCYSNFPAVARVHIFVLGEKNGRRSIVVILHGCLSNLMFLTPIAEVTP